MQFRTLTIPALGVETLRTAGKVFFCTAASAAFKVQPDGYTPIDQNQGRGFGSAQSDTAFDGLTFSNTSGIAIVITFYWGFEDFKGDPSIVSTSVPTTSVNTTSDTFATGRGALADLAPAAVSANFTGVDGAGKKRKQIIVTNKALPPLDPSSTAPNVLEVRGSDGNRMGTIFPQQSFTFESGGLITVAAPAANALAVAWDVGEIWFN